jgi:hypothetical protein
MTRSTRQRERMRETDESEDQEGVRACPECESDNLVYDSDRGELICEDCGLFVEEDKIDPGPQWRESPNDERWKRAEQLRAPAAGGVTTSGLPRRVPRANLVAGTAQEQESAAPVGPQVSRSPDDVRGRLTNLRRGIQQGRQAGSSAGGAHSAGRGFGSPYPQER